MPERTGDFAVTQAQAGHSDKDNDKPLCPSAMGRMANLVESLVEKNVSGFCPQKRAVLQQKSIFWLVLDNG